MGSWLTCAYMQDAPQHSERMHKHNKIHATESDGSLHVQNPKPLTLKTLGLLEWLHNIRILSDGLACLKVADFQRAAKGQYAMHIRLEQSAPQDCQFADVQRADILPAEMHTKS